MLAKQKQVKYMDFVKIIDERFNPDEEYLGTDKEVNRIQPIVSVYIPTYQQKDFISECIESVVSQKTSFPYEVLIGEDESTDGTREICMDFAKKYPDKIRLFLRSRETSVLLDNDGNKVAYLNNKFLRKSCRGQFYAVCEGDDYWIDNKKLEKQVQLMRQYPECTMSYHSVILHLHQSGEKIIANKHHQETCIVNSRNIVIGGGAYCPTCSLMFRKEVFYDDISWMYTFPVGDYFMQMYASLKGSVLYIDEIMGVYRKGVPDSWTARTASTEAKFRHTINMLKSMKVFNRKTNFRYHKDLKQRENMEIYQSLKNAYSYSREEIRMIKSVIRDETEGGIKLKCYYNLLKSLLYHKFNLYYVTKMMRKLNLR